MLPKDEAANHLFLSIKIDPGRVNLKVDRRRAGPQKPVVVCQLFPEFHGLL
jgi:hypothetical protein